MEKKPPRYDFILWDVDGTLINFDLSEKASLHYCLARFGVEISDSDLAHYHEINAGYWRRLERGEMTKPQILRERFVDFFKYLGVSHINPDDMNHIFQEALGENCVLIDDALELCLELRKNTRQYAVTNGTAMAQKSKLKNTGLDKLMDGVFISEELGFEKPDPRFFDSCFSKIPDFSRDKALLIGDSLTSDIRGGNNAGLDCCWFNPRGLPADPALNIKYTIKTLSELRDIIF